MESFENNGNFILGCDIGNGFGYISCLYSASADPETLFPTGYGLEMLGMPTTAFVSAPSGEPILVFSGGKSVEEQTRCKRSPERFVRAVKTRLKEKNLAISGVEPLVETDKIYAAIARDLISLAHERLGDSGRAPVYDIVFTFPSSFADDTEVLERMQRSIESIDMGGKKIRVAGRLPEPAAVAIDYLYYMQNIAPEEIKITKDDFTVLVYDLGHGTFDTAVVTASSKGEPYRLHTKSGLPAVGGKDFDELIYREFCTLLEREHGYTPKESEKENVRKAAVDAKIELTDKEVSVQEIQLDNTYMDVSITRERFEKLGEYLITQTLELVQEVLENAEENGIKIDCVVLSGGSSRMPMVKRTLEELLEGSMPVVLYRPSQAVSYGAARYAYGITQKREKGKAAAEEKPAAKKNGASNSVMEQLTDCCYGIWLPAPNKLAGEVKFLIKCGEKRPAASEKAVIYSNSACLQVKLYRYAEKNKNADTADTEECESVIWLPFDVTPGARCTVSITAEEDYSLKVRLESDKDGVREKSTSDIISNLI